MTTENPEPAFELDLHLHQEMPRSLARAIRALSVVADTAHTAYHHGIIATNIRPNPDGEGRLYDPVNLESVTWRECPKSICQITRREIENVINEWAEDR